ncbi:MAG TPA: pilus assembly protein TadG-related protein [Candidatus Limnocylindrales bacterium]|nr:pilus assembly protein TadG-related protein [Candidatus Limnocylindrales bacterium]
MTTSDAPRNRGQVLALFALFLVVLIGATAITIDYGSWLKARRDYQNIADAAVLAGGGFLSRPLDSTKQTYARRAAWESLNDQLNLGINDTQLDTLEATNPPPGTPSEFAGYRLWVSTPPIDAATKYPGIFRGATDRYLFAWVEKDNPSFFSRIFGQGERTVSAWATAGVFPSQFAVITLRQNGQGPMSAPSDISLDGTGTVLEVFDGDVGGNWGMKLTASANLWLRGDADVYLVDYVSCGNSCWSANQVSSGPPSPVLEDPQQLPSIIDDPNYPLPSVFTSLPTGAGLPPAIPTGLATDVPPPADRAGDITFTNEGTISGVGCSADSPRIGPGWYDDIVVTGGCLILDPLHVYTDPHDADANGDFGELDVPASQRPGIFYITGALNVTNALVVGDGVSLVLRDQSQPGLNVSNNGIVDLNTGASDGMLGNPTRKKAAFKTDGSYSYAFDSTAGVWQYTADNNDKSSVGVAIYVIKPSQVGNMTSDANTSSVKIDAGAALSWQGILYGPRDNISLSGQPNHNAIGQFICWTVKVAGGATIQQIYDGPGEAAPRLVEPRLGQ